MISTTIIGYGETSKSKLKTFMDRLDDHLSTYYPSISWHLYDVGLKKGTLGELAQEVKEKVLIHHPNIVFIRLSSQDVDMERADFVGREVLEEQLRSILQQISTHNNRTGLNHCMPIPVLITPPPVLKQQEKKGRSNNRLKQYIYGLKQVAKEENAVIIDLFEIINKKSAPNYYLMEEGYELSQEGENLLYDLVFIELTKLINYQGVIKERH